MLDVTERLARHGKTESPHEWDADLFLRFAEERSSPTKDLLARVEASPKIVFDLGCGPGTSTQLLLERFPASTITGIDSSPAMLARAIHRHRGAAFQREDIATWRPSQTPDLIFADGALQWVEGHETLFPRLMSFLAPGGTLAAQMPDNREEPAHALMRRVAAEGPWASKLAPVARTRAPIRGARDYENWLRPLSSSLEIWLATYIHPVDGIDAIVEWFRGSALRPYLAPLSEREQVDFLDSFRHELALAYDSEPGGRVLFPYPRLFLLARRK